MTAKDLQAIDVHAHFGDYRQNKSELVNEFCSADAETVVFRAKAANTRLTFVSPLRALTPRFNNDPVGGNEEAVSIIEQTDGLMQWVVVDPLKPKTYQQAEEILKRDQCVGIKIHPEEHGYKITEHGRAFFEFAAAHGAMVMLGSYIVDPGDDVDYPAAFVFKPGIENYADYLRQHIAKAKESKGKVAVSVCAADLQNNLDFLKTAQDAGADYVSYCAHSTMEMFLSKNQSSMFCNRANWGTLEKWATAIVKAVSISVIFKIGIHGTDEEIVGTTEILN